MEADQIADLLNKLHAEEKRRMADDYARSTKLVAELMDENRRLWLAVGYLKEAVGTYDAVIRECSNPEIGPNVQRADEGNECVVKADDLLDNMVPLKPAS